MSKFNGAFTDNIITVCHHCEFRHVGCHSTCQPYLEQKAEQKRLREQEYNGVKREMIALAHRVKLRHTKKQIHDERCKGH